MEATMAIVTGIGGVFFKSRNDSAALAAWYQEHCMLAANERDNCGRNFICARTRLPHLWLLGRLAAYYFFRPRAFSQIASARSASWLASAYFPLSHRLTDSLNNLCVFNVNYISIHIASSKNLTL